MRAGLDHGQPRSADDSVLGVRLIRLSVLLPLLFAGCAHLTLKPAQAPQELAAKKLLAKLELAAKELKFNDLASLFTPHCLSSCSGFRPMVLKVRPGTVHGRWLARLEPGHLMEDLSSLLLSYAPGFAIQLTPERIATYPPGVVLIRARLLVQGKAGEGQAVSDHGLVDLELRQNPAGWRIHRLAFVKVYRDVALPTEEEPLAEEETENAPASAPSSQPAGPAAQLPQDPLSLTTGPQHQSLAALAGDEATVVLLRTSDCETCSALCSSLSQALDGRKGVKLVELLASPSPDPPCPTGKRVLADETTRQLIELLDPFLPLVGVTGPASTTQWLIAPDTEMLEAALDQLVPR